MFSRNSRILIVALMTLLFAGQSVASVAVSSRMVTFDVGHDRSKASCHDDQMDVASDMAETSMPSESPSNCCEVDCHCPSGSCVSVAIPAEVTLGSYLTALPAKNSLEFQWFINQIPSSLYRPPIKL